MTSFFNDDSDHMCDSDIDDISIGSENDIKNCPHDIIVDSHCQLCGIEIFGRCSIVNEDLNSFDAPKAKRIISNDVIIAAAQELPLDSKTKGVLISNIESHCIQLKNNKDATTKLLCVYGFQFCIQSGLIECTPDRFFEICGVKKKSSKVFKDIIKILSKGIINSDTVSYIHPITYIKEFLYVMWTKKAKMLELNDDDEIPVWYENLNDVKGLPLIPQRYICPPEHEDIIMFCEFLLSRRKVMVSNLTDAEKVDLLAGISHHFTNGDSNTVDVDEYIKDYDYMFKLPQRIAAATLYNVLTFSLDNLMDVDECNKILKVECGEPAQRLYTAQDVRDYYHISDSALNNLIKKMGVRCMSNRNKKKTIYK